MQRRLARSRHFLRGPTMTSRSTRRTAVSSITALNTQLRRVRVDPQLDAPHQCLGVDDRLDLRRRCQRDASDLHRGPRRPRLRLQQFLRYRSSTSSIPICSRLALATKLTRKYAVEIFGTWNLDRDEFQTVGSRIERRFPQWTLDVGLDYDNIDDSVSLGVSVRPVGLASETRTRVFTQDEDAIDVLASPSRLRATRLNSGPFDR